MQQRPFIQLLSSLVKNEGPFHHSEWLTNVSTFTPLEIKSARVSSQATCLQYDSSVRFRMPATRFATNVFNSFTGFLNQEKKLFPNLTTGRPSPH